MAQARSLVGKALVPKTKRKKSRISEWAYLEGVALEPKRVQAALEAVVREGARANRLAPAFTAAQLHRHFFTYEQNQALAEKLGAGKILPLDEDGDIDEVPWVQLQAALGYAELADTEIGALWGYQLVTFDDDATFKDFYAVLARALPKARPAAVEYWLNWATPPFLVELLKHQRFSKLWSAAVDRLAQLGKAGLAAKMASKMPALQRLAILAAHGKHLSKTKADVLADAIAQALPRVYGNELKRSLLLDEQFYHLPLKAIVRDLITVMPDKGERMWRRLYDSGHRGPVVEALIHIDALRDAAMQQALTDEMLVFAVGVQPKRYLAVLSERARGNLLFRNLLLMSPIAQAPDLAELINALHHASDDERRTNQLTQQEIAATPIDEFSAIIERAALDDAMWHAVAALRSLSTNARAARAVEQLIDNPKCKSRLSDLARAVMAVGDEETVAHLNKIARRHDNVMLRYAMTLLTTKFKRI